MCIRDSIAISQKISPFTIKEIKVFSYLGIGYFIAVCLSVLFSGQARELSHYIARDLYFLLAPFIALAIYKSEINLNYLIVGTKISLLVLSIIVFFGISNGDLTGVMNPIIFGNLAVLLFFIVLVLSQGELLKHRIFTIASLSCGFFAIIGASSRGSWLSFLLLLSVYFYFLYKQKNKYKNKIKFIFIFAILSLFLLGFFNQTVNTRVTDAFSQSISYITEKEEPRLGYVDYGVQLSVNSVNERLVMYRAGINNIADVPFFGYGYRTSNVVLFQNDTSIFGRAAVGYNHLHNGYLTSYYNGGIVLLSALLLILFIPLKKFIKANNHDRKNPLFILGALLILGYASFGLVNILLGDTYMNGFYVFFLAIFLLQTNKSLKASEV